MKIGVSNNVENNTHLWTHSRVVGNILVAWLCKRSVKPTQSIQSETINLSDQWWHAGWRAQRNISHNKMTRLAYLNVNSNSAARRCPTKPSVILQYIKNNAWVTVNNNFGSRVKWFANDLHEWRSHEWKSLANHLTSNPKSLFTETNVLFYSLHAILCLEHTIPLQTNTFLSFRYSR